MAVWNEEIARQVKVQGETNCEALGRTLETALEFEHTLAVTVGSPVRLDSSAAETTFVGDLLVFTFRWEDGRVRAYLPLSTPGLPIWLSQPDDSQQARLSQLAADLGELLFPTDRQPNGSEAEVTPAGSTVWSESLAGCCLPLTLQWDAHSAILRLIGPPPEAATTGQPESTSTAPSPARPKTPRIRYQDLDDGIRQLPPYSRSLLKISVPVKVTLAETRLPLKRILELGPGSIIQFEKSCEENLTLEAGEQPIATGEAVKVGDKFGLWVTSIALPSERFFVIRGQAKPHRIR